MSDVIQQPAEQRTPPQRRLSEEQVRLWRAWLTAQLIQHRYAYWDSDGKIHYHLPRLERVIAEKIPDAPVSIETLRTVVYRGSIPTHPTARGLAAALDISEIAILLRSGQLDWDAVMPLLGPAPAMLRSEVEYQETLARLETEIPDPAFRTHIANLLDREWRFSQWLAERLRWLGISEAEWETIRQDLNSPAGRRRLGRALYTADAADDDPSSIPQEFLNSAKRSKS